MQSADIIFKFTVLRVIQSKTVDVKYVEFVNNIHRGNKSIKLVWNYPYVEIHLYNYFAPESKPSYVFRMYMQDTREIVDFQDSIELLAQDIDPNKVLRGMAICNVMFLLNKGVPYQIITDYYDGDNWDDSLDNLTDGGDVDPATVHNSCTCNFSANNLRTFECVTCMHNRYINGE